MKEKFNSEIGNRIHKLREEKGYTKEELAEIVGISVSHIYQIENSKRGFTTWILHHLSQVFDVSTDYLIYGQTSNLKSIKLIKTLEDLSVEKRTKIEGILMEIIKLS